jgi:hypothetical protein
VSFVDKQVGWCDQKLHQSTTHGWDADCGDAGVDPSFQKQK